MGVYGAKRLDVSFTCLWKYRRFYCKFYFLQWLFSVHASILRMNADWSETACGTDYDQRPSLMASEVKAESDQYLSTPFCMQLSHFLTKNNTLRKVEFEGANSP